MLTTNMWVVIHLRKFCITSVHCKRQHSIEHSIYIELCRIAEEVYAMNVNT